MRVEYHLTFEDFRAAQEAHSVASARANPGFRLAAASWQWATILCSIALVWRFDPWSVDGADLPHWFVVCILVPALPWIFILAYILWFQTRLAEITANLLKPWERVKENSGKRVNREPVKNLRGSGFLALGLAFGAMAYSMLNHDRPGPYFLIQLAYGFGVAKMPWGIYSLWNEVSSRTARLPRLQSAWEQQTELHEPATIEVVVEGIKMERAGSRTEYKWTAIGGLLEAADVFLMYRSVVTFHIIPKRAFASAEQMAAFRTMVENLAGRATSGFPILPFKPTPEGSAVHAPPVANSK